MSEAELTASEQASANITHMIASVDGQIAALGQISDWTTEQAEELAGKGLGIAVIRTLDEIHELTHQAVGQARSYRGGLEKVAATISAGFSR